MSERGVISNPSITHLLFCAALAGCRQGPRSFEELFTQYGEVACRWQVQCDGIGASREATCQESHALAKRSVLSAIERELAADRLGFDPSAAERCIARLRNGTCATAFLDLDLHCAGVGVPKVPVGEPCNAFLRSFAWLGQVSECIGGYCARLPGSCGGRCVPGLGLGERCSRDALCAAPALCLLNSCRLPPNAGDPCPDGVCHPEHFCSVTSDEPQQGTCRPPAGAGQSCRAVGSYFNRCARGLVCDHDAPGGPTCVPPFSEGASCREWGDQCSDGLRCAGGTCLPWLDLGSPCGIGKGVCPIGSSCDFGGTNTCVAQPVPAPGDPCPCSGTPFTLLACDETTNRCVPPLDLGAACVPSERGPLGICLGRCDPITRTCVPYCY